MDEPLNTINKGYFSFAPATNLQVEYEDHQAEAEEVAIANGANKSVWIHLSRENMVYYKSLGGSICDKAVQQEVAAIQRFIASGAFEDNDYLVPYEIENDTGYILAPFYKNKDLSSVESFSKLAVIAEHLSRGLEYQFEHNEINFDIKPDNIFVLPDDKALYFDFGSVFPRSLVDTPVKLSSQLLNIGRTNKYTAPELEWNSQEDYGDSYNPEEFAIWSLGMTLLDASSKLSGTEVALRKLVKKLERNLVKNDEMVRIIGLIVKDESLQKMILNMLRLKHGERSLRVLPPPDNCCVVL